MARTFLPNSYRWAASITVAAFLGAIYWQFSEPHGKDVFIDFMKAYYPAGGAVLGRDLPTLRSLLADAYFVNLPIIAWLFAPIALLGPNSAPVVFSAAGLLAVIIAFATIARLCDRETRPLLFLLFVANGPLWYSLKIGNTSHFVLLLLAIALLTWRQNRRYPTGLILGCAGIIKPPFLLYGVYFLWRRNWPVVLGGATMVGLATLSSLAVFGWAINVEWYEFCIAPFARDPMGAHNVQSIDAFLLRLTTAQQYLLDWQPHPLASGLSVLRTAIDAVLLALALFAIRRPRHKSEAASGGNLDSNDYLEYALVGVLAVVLSTVSWTHYYCIFLLPWGLYFAGLFPPAPTRWVRPLVWITIVLCSMPVYTPNLEPTLLASLMARSIESIWIFGGLLLVVALVLASRGGRRPNGEPAWPATVGKSEATA